MTIPFEEIEAQLLANPKVKAEYDALEAEFRDFRKVQAQDKNGQTPPEKHSDDEHRRV